MTHSEYRPRLTLDATEEQIQRLRDLVPHGLRGAVLGVLLNKVLDDIERNPNTLVDIVKGKLGTLKEGEE